MFALSKPVPILELFFFFFFFFFNFFFFLNPILELGCVVIITNVVVLWLSQIQRWDPRGLKTNKLESTHEGVTSLNICIFESLQSSFSFLSHLGRKFPLMDPHAKKSKLNRESLTCWVYKYYKYSKDQILLGFGLKMTAQRIHAPC